MSLILQKIWQGLEILEEYAHPRTKDWFFVSNPLSMVLILGGWLYFCLEAGPRFMKHRKPYELKKTLLVYNFLQICLSFFMFYEGGINAWFWRYSFSCEPVSYSDHPSDIRITEIVWWYLFAKLTELLDTVFFVLRKKNNHLSALHIYHHAVMPIVGWVAVKFAPGGHGTLIGWINSFVHIIMYGYYLLSGLGPRYQKYLWWKKYLTVLQLVQFCIIFWHNFSVLFRDCDYPRLYSYLSMIESLLFIYMFGNFYYKTYISSPKQKIDKYT